MPRIAPFEAHHERYDSWFERHDAAYYSELLAVRALLPWDGRGLEVGVGTGRFAAPLGVQWGVDPSPVMRSYAARRGISTWPGTAEELPFEDESFDTLLAVTTICFVDDAQRMLTEARRVLRPNGQLVIGFIDRAHQGRPWSFPVRCRQSLPQEVSARRMSQSSPTPAVKHRKWMMFVTESRCLLTSGTRSEAPM